VKDLETRLQQLEQAQQQTATENERLKRDLQKMSTENEILRATSMTGGNSGSPRSNETPTTTGPMSYNPTDFYSNVLQNHVNKTPSHRIVTSDDGERLLAAGATWDLIINHELFKRGLVDIGDVSARLKSQAKCDGQGPVFEERAILEAIEESVASGSDELL
jgi:AP-1-like transcription factor